MALRGWRNWQTRTFEGRMGSPVRVQVPLSAPFLFYTSIKYEK